MSRSSALPATRGATTWRPGASKSGLDVDIVGVPQAENQPTTSSLSESVTWSSVDPTVTAYGSMPGDSTCPLAGPVLPAAATTTRPNRQATSTPAARGSVRYEGPSGVAPRE